MWLGWFYVNTTAYLNHVPGWERAWFSWSCPEGRKTSRDSRAWNRVRLVGEWPSSPLDSACPKRRPVPLLRPGAPDPIAALPPGLPPPAALAMTT
jgi:hypothetical protein